jgi:hypothetical protein
VGICSQHILIQKGGLIDSLIDGCLMPTLAVFQYYRGVHKFYILDTQIDGNYAHGTVRNISAF